MSDKQEDNPVKGYQKEPMLEFYGDAWYFSTKSLACAMGVLLLLLLADWRLDEAITRLLADLLLGSIVAHSEPSQMSTLLLPSHSFVTWPSVHG